MEASILKSVKKVLGLDASYTAFDEDILMHINSTFSVLQQLGVGPIGGFSIDSQTANWTDFVVPAVQLNLVKTYMTTKVKLLFDPPTTSFHLSAAKELIEQYEWRLNVMREMDLPDPVVEEEDP